MTKEKKVSASWIVRDAVEKYIQGETPAPPVGQQLPNPDSSIY